MLPGSDREDIIQRGQLPVYIPNYYRGAFRQFPRTAGRSSHLFNTGTVSWYYRCLIDGLFGLQGNKEGLCINPKLPADWQYAAVKRTFRGASFDIEIRRKSCNGYTELYVDGVPVIGDTIKDIKEGTIYKVIVYLGS
jgi:cellobionic acid phosphorylase